LEWTTEEKSDKESDIKVKMVAAGVDYEFEPLKLNQDARNAKDPPGSGGFNGALYQYRHLLTAGPKGFEGGFHHGGFEPLYLPPSGEEKPDYAKLRVDTEVLRSQHAGVSVKWYFAVKDQALLGFEVTPDKDEDPCEVYLSEYKEVDGRKLPHRIDVRFADDSYASLKVSEYKLK